MNRFTWIILIAVISCTSSENRDRSLNDTTTLIPDTVTQTPVVVAAPPPQNAVILVDGQLTVKGVDTIIYIPNQWGFISDPYDFPLDPDVIKQLLGEETQSKEEEYEGGEDYDAYSYYTVSNKETELRFYSYAGKHYSSITTPLLPLKRGIRIGMTKQDFLNAMNFKGDSLSYATLFSLYDDYGNMDFRFRADTLYLIYASWEEGD